MGKHIGFIALGVVFFLIILLVRLKAGSLEINMENFIGLYKKQGLQLLDVRTSREYQSDGHIKGFRLVPLSELSNKGEAALPRLDKKKPVYIICRSGNRSLVAARILKSLGFEQVYSIKGGVTAWAVKRHPLDFGKK